MLSKVRAYIARHALLSRDTLHLVALSGGADSVALLCCLRELGYRIEAAHCNFHLRGEESDRDEQFCLSLCQQLAVPLHRTHFDTRAYADLHHVSIEMAARTLRYTWFEQLRQALAADDIAVAHHQDDNVETVLLNLIRGTGLRGLAGMRPKRAGIVRPLLAVTRADITAYLTQRGLPHVDDSTNAVPDVLRNRIRLQVLPLLADINPAAARGIARTASNLQQAEAVYDDAIARALQDAAGDVPAGDVAFQPRAPLAHDISSSNDALGQSEATVRLSGKCPARGRNATSPAGTSPAYSTARLLAMPSPQAVLFALLTPAGFTPRQVAEVAAALGATDRHWLSPTHTAAIDRGVLRLVPTPPLPPTLRIPEPGTYHYAGQRLRLTLSADTTPSRDPCTATLDADAIRFPLTIRPIAHGDRMQPYGMHGTQRVSDMLTNAKAHYLQRRQQTALVDSNGTILWLPGLRTARAAAITHGTRQALTIQLLPASDTDDSDIRIE